MDRLRLVIILGALAFAGCATPQQAINQSINNALVKYLVKNGYTPFIMPSSLESAGALVSKDNAGHLQVEGDLKSCGMPEAVLFGPNPEKYRDATFPGIDLSGQSDFNIGVVAGYAAVGGSLGADRERRISIKTTKAGHEVLNGLSVKGYLRDPKQASTLDANCVAAINSKDVAIIMDAAYIEGGTITFHGKDAASIKLDKAAVINAWHLKPSLSASTGADNTLTFDKRIYVAFKLAEQPAESTTLGGGESWKDVTGELAAAVGQ